MVVVAVLCGPASAQAGTLVALGDSYSSGDGAAPYTGATDLPPRPCKRSRFDAWPVLVGRALGHDVQHLACSGATAVEITTGLPDDPQVMRRRAQLALAAPNPDVVTLTVGGNDAGFAEVIQVCLVGPCDAYYKAFGRDRLARRIRALEPTLAAVYDAVRRRAGVARVLVSGYPRLFPDDGTPNCAFGRAVQPHEATYLNRTTRALNHLIETLAGRAGHDYVPVTDAFDGGELRCGRPGFVNAFPSNPFAFDDHTPFHPSPRGQRRLAEVVLEQIRR